MTKLMDDPATARLRKLGRPKLMGRIVEMATELDDHRLAIVAGLTETTLRTQPKRRR